ncbi:hypothetical protein EUGRSUZ_K00767 [Eucalyptus grandis]|uniref:Uncharacterized protein n=2 Tax=Eucalyptus grandis TaxID=71139 RepID=A0A058ZZW4_EUCGR|nr:hypothetical protein EUGRSUZ_K00767 [Eucalyptus grandis]
MDSEAGFQRVYPVEIPHEFVQVPVKFLFLYHEFHLAQAIGIDCDNLAFLFNLFLTSLLWSAIFGDAEQADPWTWSRLLCLIMQHNQTLIVIDSELLLYMFFSPLLSLVHFP